APSSRCCGTDDDSSRHFPNGLTALEERQMFLERRNVGVRMGGPLAVDGLLLSLHGLVELARLRVGRGERVHILWRPFRGCSQRGLEDPQRHGAVTQLITG